MSIFVCLLTTFDGAIMEEILTLKELAEYLKVNEKTIYRLSSEGKIPAFKVGNKWRFKKESIEQWIEEQNIFQDKNKK
jgi:excisionase family DNA binding protein